MSNKNQYNEIVRSLIDSQTPVHPGLARLLYDLSDYKTPEFLTSPLVELFKLEVVYSSTAKYQTSIDKAFENRMYISNITSEEDTLWDITTGFMKNT